MYKCKLIFNTYYPNNKHIIRTLIHHVLIYIKQSRHSTSLYKSIIARLRLSMSFRLLRDREEEVERRSLTDKVFFHDSLAARQIRARVLVRRFERVNFTPRRLAVRGLKQISTTLRDSIAPERLLDSITTPLPIIFRFSRKDARMVKRDKVAGISSFVSIARPFALLYIPSRNPLYLLRRRSLPVLPLSNVYGRESRSLLKRVSRDLFPSSGCAPRQVRRAITTGFTKRSRRSVTAARPTAPRRQLDALNV